MFSLRRSAPTEPTFASEKARITKLFIWFQIIAFASFAPMNYYTIYLRKIGFSSELIGFWGSIGAGLTIITLPIWGMISDKLGSAKITYLISMAVYAVVYIAFPPSGKLFPGNPIPIYICILLYGLVRQPTHSLQDSWFIQTTAPYGVPYTKLRLWGSAGFGVLAILIGLTVDTLISLDMVFYLPTVLIAIEFLMAFLSPKPRCLPEAAPAVKVKKEKVGLKVLLTNYYYMTSLIIALALAIYMALTSNFYAFILEHAGVPTEKYGIISGYGALVQVACMLAVTKWGKNIPSAYLLIGAGFVAVIENILYGLAHGMPMMLMIATIWGIEIGINVSVVPRYIFSLVPPSHAATAQTFLGSCTTALSMAGSLVGGYLISAFGIAKYNFMVAGFQCLLVLLFAFSLWFGPHVLHLPAVWKETKGL